MGMDNSSAVIQSAFETAKDVITASTEVVIDDLSRTNARSNWRIVSLKEISEPVNRIWTPAFSFSLISPKLPPPRRLVENSNGQARPAIIGSLLKRKLNRRMKNRAYEWSFRVANTRSSRDSPGEAAPTNFRAWDARRAIRLVVATYKGASRRRDENGESRSRGRKEEASS